MEFHQITIDEYLSIKEDLRKRLNHLAESFVAIGYRLKQIRDSEAYRQDGYESIFEFAQKEFGLTKSPASRFMAINDRYSVGGNSLELRQEFIGLGKSRLSEMLTMDPENYILVTDQTSIKEIRELKHMERNPGEELTKFQEMLWEEYKDSSRREELLEIARAKSIEDVKAAVIPEGYRLMKKGILAVKFEKDRITVRTMGTVGIQELTWEEILKEYDQTFDFAAEDPWKEAYQEEEKTEEETGTKAESMPVATSQQEDRKQTKKPKIAESEKEEREHEEDEIPGQTSIEKDFPEYLPEEKKEIPQTAKPKMPEPTQYGRRHKLKLSKIFFEDVRIGKKTFELRKNDRNYQVGDILELREMEAGEPTGREIETEVIYILEGFEGLKEGYCILGIR